uniref:Lipoprotein n=1 Tax=Rhizobium phage LG08 TaxID=3129229 RepID=A0AAU8HYV7_9CAUD
MKTFLSMIALLALTSCAAVQKEIVLQPVHQKIPERYLMCTELKKNEYPKPDSLKDKETAKLIVKMDKRISECAANARAVRELQKSIPPQGEPSSSESKPSSK